MENAETTIFISSSAFRVKRQWLQNDVFHVLDSPWSPPGPEPFFSRPPRSLPKRTLELQGRPEILPRGPRASKGQIKFTKSACSKPYKYVYLAPKDLNKNTLGPFFDAPNSPPGPSRVAPLILKVASGPPKSSPGPPGTPPGAPQDPPGTP